MTQIHMFTDSKLVQYLCMNCTKDHSLQLWAVLLGAYKNCYVLQYVPQYSTGSLFIIACFICPHHWAQTASLIKISDLARETRWCNVRLE